MTTKATSKKKAVDFETNLEQLEALVAQMEAGDMSLEDSLKAFEDGVKLTRLCQEKLAKAEQKVQKLVASQGGFSLEALETDDENDY